MLAARHVGSMRADADAGVRIAGNGSVTTRSAGTLLVRRHVVSAETVGCREYRVVVVSDCKLTRVAGGQLRYTAPPSEISRWWGLVAGNLGVRHVDGLE